MSEHVFDREVWAHQDIFYQLGNISSEVGRALKAKRDGNEKRMRSAFFRGMDLMNATVDAWVERGKSPYELLVAREQFAKSILTNDEDSTLDKYFMDFAIAARINR